MIAVIALAFASAGLYEQSVARVLAEHFRTPGLSYIAMNAETGVVFASNWTKFEEPVAVGSLVKPFLAVAAPPATEFTCGPGLCWLPRGHGRIDVSEAIAHSCNSWFLQLAGSMGRASATRVALRFGLPEPPRVLESSIGIGSGWRIAPPNLMRAYASLLRDPDAGAVIEGMRMSAASGTGRLVDAECLIKTGTAPCGHQPRAEGDGFALVAFPARAPRTILLVRVHRTTGSNAARIAGEMLRRIGADQ